MRPPAHLVGSVSTFRSLSASVDIFRRWLLAAKMASARRGSRMRSTGEAGVRGAHVLDAVSHSPKLAPSSPAVTERRRSGEHTFPRRTARKGCSAFQPSKTRWRNAAATPVPASGCLAEVKNGLLNDPPASNTLVLDNAIVAMPLAVLLANPVTQKHGGAALFTNRPPAK